MVNLIYLLIVSRIALLVIAGESCHCFITITMGGSCIFGLDVFTICFWGRLADMNYS